MTHWSCRLMAEAQEVSKNTVNRLWQLHNLKPHLSRTLKLSRDAKFLEKLTDVVGLYLNPPDQTLVLCLDEKSQIQALDRTQPGLPLKKGRCGTMTHDYKRNGTTTLFAALNVLDGKVIGECHGRHRHQEWLKFLRRLDREFPKGVQLHLVMDNYGTHKEPHVKAWLKKHPRFVCHFVPTSSSWLNLVERWFRELTEKAIRRGSFLSVPDLKQAIEKFMEAWNENPMPFGSCFAEYFIQFLAAHGFNDWQLPDEEDPHCDTNLLLSLALSFENIFVIVQHIRWAFGEFNPVANLWFTTEKRRFDATEGRRAKARRSFDEADVVVITLGLSEVWFDQVANEPMWRTIPSRLYDPQRHI